MTTALYSWCAGISTTYQAPHDSSWPGWVVLAGAAALWGGIVWLAIKAENKPEHDGREVPSSSPGSWGDPDLAPPSTSAEALAEVAELEALWREPRRRRRASSE